MHTSRIADAADLLIIVFQYPLAGGQGYPLTTPLKIVESVQTVRAVKTGVRIRSCTSARSAPARAGPAINVLTTHSAWCSALAMGCGAAVGSGSVIADLQVPCSGSARRRPRGRAQDSIRSGQPPRCLRRAVVHAQPDEEALVLLGKLPRAVVRPPLVKIPAAEIERIRNALVAAALLTPERTRKQA